MLLIFKTVFVFQAGLLSVFCNDAVNISDVDPGFILNCDLNCTLPEYPQNGLYMVLERSGLPSPGEIVSNNTFIEYKCDSGYEPFGSSVALCINGHWKTQFQECQKKITCALPTNPSNGSYNLSGSNVSLAHEKEVPNWSLLTFLCEPTFKIIGNRLALCWNGIWTAEVPQCQKTTSCVLPDLPRQGSYSVLGLLNPPVPGSLVKELQVLQYECPATNILRGAYIIACINGKWLPEAPSCIDNKRCTLPSAPVNGKIEDHKDVDEVLSGIQVNSLSLIRYSCRDVYDLVESSSAICQNGIWSAGPPICQKSSRCVLPDLPNGGSYFIIGSQETPIPGTVIKEGEALRYNCTYRTSCVYDHIIVCSKGEWLPGVVECDSSACENVSGGKSDVYLIQPNNNGRSFYAYCDLTLTGEKWTVIQQRFSADVDFNRTYNEYSEGFGNITGNHWLGLENIHEITKDGNHELYVEMEMHNGTKAYARYTSFSIGSSSTGFKLIISGYNGTAGDSLTYHNEMKFSTFDKDQDNDSTGSCSKLYNGAWWYNNCYISNLNGRYYDNGVSDTRSMCWRDDLQHNALKSSCMLVRRK